MEKIKLTIKGVIFALFPDYDKTKPGSEELVKQATEHLSELNLKRPPVILVPEPDNVYDPKAIRAWCKGKPIGRVAADETSQAHKLFDAEHEMVMTRIVEVEVKRKGNIYVEAELPEGALQGKKELPDYEHIWKRWQFDLPAFPQPESWKACRVEEFSIKMLASCPENMEELMRCIESWTDNSLHDFSKEAMQTRRDYINMLSSMDDNRLLPYIQRLKRQYGAIGGGHRMKYRMEWWNEIEHSDRMEQYWDQWRSGLKEDNLYKDLYTVDIHLRRMPDGLYASIGDLKVLFSALRYRDVPRSILWNIYTLLLLRQRICRELGIAMKPLPINAYGVESEDTMGEEIPMDETSNECLSEAKESAKPRSKGRTPESLFKNKDGEKDEAITQEWATLFEEYLTHHKAMNKEIDTRKDNYVSRTFVVFYQKWVKSNLVSSLPNGNACFQFLHEDCGLALKVNKCTFANHIRKMITDAKDLDLWDIESNVNVFLKSHNR